MPTAPPSTQCPRLHTVQRGETLTLIGWRYHVSVWDIARANRLYNLNLIYVGQQLCIP